MGYSRPSGDVKIIAESTDTTNEGSAFPLIYSYEKDSKDMNGFPIPARRITSYLFEGGEKVHTDSGWKLLRYSLAWAMGILK